MTRKGTAITLSLQERHKQALQKIALDLGITWGDKPNISKLIEAIARHQFLVLPNADWEPARINALDTARKILLDNGKEEESRIITELLVSRHELLVPLRGELQQLLAQTKPSWRRTIDTLIASNRPFQLTYHDASDRPTTFTIRYATITPIEKRQYLQCWCEETNDDIPPLNHNWTLRLDRIPTAAITPIKGKWHKTLATLPVTLHLYDRLASAYESKPNDLENDWLSDQPYIRQVIRATTSTFWLYRELLPYGADCAIISPPAVVDLFRQKIQQLNDRYKTHSPPAEM